MADAPERNWVLLDLPGQNRRRRGKGKGKETVMGATLASPGAKERRRAQLLAELAALDE